MRESAVVNDAFRFAEGRNASVPFAAFNFDMMDAETCACAIEQGRCAGNSKQDSAVGRVVRKVERDTGTFVVKVLKLLESQAMATGRALRDRGRPNACAC